eukprot:6086962-Ditylum_brightwellii.AAC.1
MERTNQMEETGTLFFICKNQMQLQSPIFWNVNYNFFTKVLYPVDSTTKMPIPSCTNHQNVRAVGSYQEILTGHGNPQEESNLTHAKH